MKLRKPIVAVTGPDKGGFPAWMFTWLAVKRAGGKPVRITPSRKKDVEFDALIIGGGADINPEMYGQDQMEQLKQVSKSEKKGFLKMVISIFLSVFIFLFRKLLSPGHTAPIDTERDDLERTLLEKAIDSQKPVLGICRGAQLINIYYGGNLHQDITDYYSEIPKIESIYPKKEIEIDTDSTLYDILGKSTLKVNSLHNQAVNEICEGLKVVAKERTGVVQAIEHRKYPFMIGVQWHPEYLPQIKTQQKIFKALIKAVDLN